MILSAIIHVRRLLLADSLFALSPRARISVQSDDKFFPIRSLLSLAENCETDNGKLTRYCNGRAHA